MVERANALVCHCFSLQRVTQVLSSVLVYIEYIGKEEGPLERIARHTHESIRD